MAVFLTGIKPVKVSENIAGKLIGYHGSSVVSVLRKVVSLVIIMISLYYTVCYFNLQLQWNPLRVVSSVAFSKEQFSRAVTTAVYVTTVMGMLSLAIEIFNSLIM